MNWLKGLLVLAAVSSGTAEAEEIIDVVLVVHGGAGSGRQHVTPEIEKHARAGLELALRAGEKVLKQADGSSLDAVEAAIRVLEDSPWFNAGKGSVFTQEGRNELDASIMDGRQRAAGAVASVTILKNPISAARAVMEKSKHVLLIGRGAEIFATKQGMEIVDPTYFWTESRWKQWQTLQQKTSLKPLDAAHTWGTVGAVALDAQGNLAAGTSTGGTPNKQYGRIGDSPIIGAGTFADNQTCGISCTGHGEFFIRYSVAHEVASLMKYKNLSLPNAAHDVMQRQLKPIGGEGGLIGLDAKGNLAMSFNCEVMYRGYLKRDGTVKVLLFVEK